MSTTENTETTELEKKLTFEIIGCAIEVHRTLGPGLLESSYQQCLAYELSHRGLRLKLQAQMPLEYKDIKLDCGYRIDFIVEDIVIVEIKAVEQLLKIHQAQMLTYLKLAKVQLGLLINFNAIPLSSGIKRLRL